MKVFLSYRRDDLGGHASLFVGRLRDRLAANYGETNVFMDVDSIPYGEDFVEYLGEQVAKADVLLAVIGPQWASEMAARAGSEDDFVRIEIEAALDRGIHVIPVLAGGASMPAAEGLPAGVLPLRRRNALSIDSGRDFGVHLGRLIEALDQAKTAPAAPPAPKPTPATRKAGDTETGPHGIELVWCAPGKFQMGDPGKQHQITLTNGFWIGKYPVTQKQWEAVMGSNPSYFKGAENPVENVSWDDVQTFITKIGNGFRLPTEAEWEYACRAGSMTAYRFGDDEGRLGDYAWSKGNSGDKTHPVGQKKPNAWGFHDMHGNVWEWCQDWYGEYPAGPATDPKGAASGADRVLRGGGWGGTAADARSADRLRVTPDYWIRYVGFRLARSSTIPAA